MGRGGPLADLLNSPDRMPLHERLRVLQGLLQGGQASQSAIVPERNGYVAQVAASPGAPHGAVLELAVELLAGQCELATQLRIPRLLIAPEGGVSVLLSETVPRADGLADVTAKDPTAHAGSQPRRDIVLQLDREIGDAAACVQGAVRQDAVRR